MYKLLYEALEKTDQNKKEWDLTQNDIYGKYIIYYMFKYQKQYISQIMNVWLIY